MHGAKRTLMTLIVSVNLSNSQGKVSKTYVYQYNQMGKL